MIRIAGNIINENMLVNEYDAGSMQLKVVDILISSNTIYEYSSMNQLNFELDLRSEIVNAARELYNSNFGFTTFRGSMCNSKYWTRTDEGGFLLKETASPYEAIADIFSNSSKYGTECSTAIVIIFYKGLHDILPERFFNDLFSDIYLMNWSNLDEDLDLADYRDLAEYLPGDCRYFKNPDVNPLTPQWQGENTIELGDGMYYGHGIGIVTAEKIVKALNNNRKSGAVESAYLLDSALRPNFKYLSNQYQNYILMNR